MKNWKIVSISCAALLLLLALGGVAGAQQGKAAARAGLRDWVGDGIGLRDFVKGLQLSEAQKEDIRTAIKARRTEILAARQELLQARLALVNEDPNGPADFGKAQSRVMELRQAIWNQVKTKLTAEQLTAVQNRRQERASAFKRAQERLQDRSGN